MNKRTRLSENTMLNKQINKLVPVFGNLDFTHSIQFVNSICDCDALFCGMLLLSGVIFYLLVCCTRFAHTFLLYPIFFHFAQITNSCDYVLARIEKPNDDVTIWNVEKKCRKKTKHLNTSILSSRLDFTVEAWNMFNALWSTEIEQYLWGERHSQRAKKSKHKHTVTTATVTSITLCNYDV